MNQGMSKEQKSALRKIKASCGIEFIMFAIQGATVAVVGTLMILGLWSLIGMGWLAALGILIVAPILGYKIANDDDEATSKL